MAGFKDLVKNGWHPEKEGTTLRGQVSSLVGRSKDSSSSSSSRAGHVSRPLSDLRDPSGFAPPPRRTGSGLEPRPPPPTPHPPPPQSSSSLSTAARRPAAHSPSHTQPPSQPSRPYQMNTTGLGTQHLPPPPARRDGADGRSPSSHSAPAAGDAKPAPPRLPPRLPPRGARDSPPPPAAGLSHPSEPYLNRGAVDRLGAAGVSVPGFGIGRSGSANVTTTTASPPPPGSAVAGPKSSGSGFGSQVDGLQKNFSKLATPSSGPLATPPPNQGTTWAQKQAAVKTASAFHKNPSSVSLADAKSAVGTANNFRQRHGDQVEASIKHTNHLNQKYGVMNKVGAYVNREHQGQAGQTGQATAGDSGMPPMGPGLPGKKKPPPPPPPKKKPGVGETTQPAAGENDEAPPPIPMSTRPAF